MNRVIVGALATLLLLSSISGATQDTATDSPRGSLEGSVVDSVTGQPVEGVHVALVSGQALPQEGVQSLLADQKPTLQVPQVTKVLPALVLGGRTFMAERSAHSVLTDGRGKFTFTGLAAGTYALSVRADGYNFQVYGQKPDSLVALPLDIREAKIDIGVIRMNPEPRISGTIIDLAGGPIAAIPVYLLGAQPSIDINGQRQFRVAGETSTDAEGRYVFEKISGGRYYVAAGSSARPEMIRVSAATTPDGGRSTVRQPAVLPYPYTYYPGVPDAALAGQIDVPAGSKVVLGDMVVPKGELRAIRGRVVDYTTGKPPESLRVTLNGFFPFLRAGRYPTEILGNAAYDRTTGAFEFANLIPGHYRVDALLPGPRSSTPQPATATLGGVPPQSAFQIVELTNSDVEGLVLTVPGGGRVRGRVVVADGKPLPVAQTNLPIPLQLMLRPITPLQPAPVVTSVSIEDGSFEVGSALEGKYRFSVGPLRDDYYVSEARLDSVRVTNGILDFSKGTVSELIFTLSPGGQIQGSVVDEKGQPVRQAQGVVFPDPLPEIIPFYQPISADTSGRFTVNGVPPGNYRIYVWEGIEPSQFFDRELLARSRGFASPVHVEKESSVSTSVPIIVQ